MTVYGSDVEAPPAGFYVPVHFPSLVVLDQRTRDGRLVKSEGFGTLDLPRSIKLQTRCEPGHGGAEVCGRIDEVQVEGSNVSGRGWLLDDAVGRRAAFLLKTKALRGNSVDLGVSQEDVSIDIRETDGGMGMVMEYTLRNAQMTSTTLVMEPAFDNAGATIPEGWSVDGIPEPESVLAEFSSLDPLHSFEFSVKTPSFVTELFTDPGLDRPTPVVVDENGGVHGHIAAWGTNHMDAGGMRITPPKSRTNYAYFANGSVLTDEGPVPTGRLVLGGNHAEKHLKWRQAIDHYANTCAAWADVAIGEDDHGIWVSGIVRPGTSDEQVHAARASALSGDWRNLGGSMELVAALSVNAPGFPIPRAEGFAVLGEQLSLVGAGVIRPHLTLADYGVEKVELISGPDRALEYLANRAAQAEAQEIAASLVKP